MSIPSVAQKVNVYDLNAVKQLFDDQARSVVLADYPENTYYSNLKLSLGALGCGLAIWSHFTTTPFPANIPILFFCAVVYFVVSSVLQYLTSYVEQDIILDTNKTNNITLRVRSNIRLNDTEDDILYSLVVEDVERKKSETFEKSAVEYIDKTGLFYPFIFENDVQRLVRRVESK
eukprot:TRINITY_DN858_c0_g1_i2.p1 TRINITY_DN858_c0_g1~~TRINITY_DN858_c0_g1_i2.p1  ORF type:complete len:175 (+),score=20.52 TRINITY_DN858_c0_g1_i2:77-601(+)